MKKLKITPHPTKTLIWWYNHRHEIDFDPPYQRRGRLWSIEDKAFLVDSIINGFDVPKLYLADYQFGQSQLNYSKLPYAIIDGKQRLEAIFDFFENRVTLRDDFRYRKDSTLNLGGLSLRDLRLKYGKVSEDFENASLDFMSVFAEDEVDINEIFVRLNKSKPLTGAEVRNAISGPVSDLVRFISGHPFFTESIKFNVSRSGDLNLAAKLLSFEYYGKMVSTKKSDLDFFAELIVDRERLELASRRGIDTLNAMYEIFIPGDPLLSSSGIIPVYYWFIRDIGSDDRWSIREFLVNFEILRKNNRDLQRVDEGDSILRSLARFDTLNRSTNDLQSHVGRFAILKEHFATWAAQWRS